jgi:hypothetical protein
MLVKAILDAAGVAARREAARLERLRRSGEDVVQLLASAVAGATATGAGAAWRRSAVAPSRIPGAGLGLFNAQGAPVIPAGELVTVYPGAAYSSADLHELAELKLLEAVLEENAYNLRVHLPKGIGLVLIDGRPHCGVSAGLYAAACAEAGFPAAPWVADAASGRTPAEAAAAAFAAHGHRANQARAGAANVVFEPALVRRAALRELGVCEGLLATAERRYLRAAIGPEERLAVVLRATRDIAAGEEVLVDYNRAFLEEAEKGKATAQAQDASAAGKHHQHHRR